MKKRFLLIGYNFHPEPTGIGKYNGEMMSWLMEHGYDCTVITSYPYYPHWKVQEPYYKNRFHYTVENNSDSRSGGSLRIFRCPQYIPNQPTGFKRMLLDFSFLLSACVPVVRLLFSKKFDFVLTVAPSFQVGLLGIIFKKLHKAKLLYHIQDLQIEAARDLQMIKSRRALDLLFRTEKFIFNACDVISSISEGMVSKITEKAKKEVVLFPNWTDTRLFYPIENKHSLRKQFGYLPTDKIILYSGAIGEKQGLTSIIEVASQLRDHSHLKFIICGSGPYKQILQDQTNALDLKNVNFLPTQPLEKFNRFLNLADAHLVLQRAGANDLVMPSKLTTIFAVGGVAIVTADAGSGLHTFISEHNMGILVESENTTALRNRIVDVLHQDCSAIAQNARKYAERFLSVDKIMAAYEAVIQKGTTPYPGRANGFAPAPLSNVIAQESAISMQKVEGFSDLPRAKKIVKTHNQ